MRPHGSVDDSLEGRDPVSLLGLRLAGEQELPVRRDDGDAVVPVVALRGRRQAGQDGVAVLLAADEHLPPGVGVLQHRRGGSSTSDGGRGCGEGGSSYQRVFEVHESPVVHGEPSLLEALGVLRYERQRQTKTRRSGAFTPDAADASGVNAPERHETEQKRLL